MFMNPNLADCPYNLQNILKYPHSKIWVFTEILDENTKSRYSIHPNKTKKYRDLKWQF